MTVEKGDLAWSAQLRTGMLMDVKGFISSLHWKSKGKCEIRLGLEW